MWSGHGIIDLAAYDAYLAGKLTDFEMTFEDIEPLVCDLKRC
jgi:tryptophan synthase beta chain